MAAGAAAVALAPEARAPGLSLPEGYTPLVLYDAAEPPPR